MKKAVIYITDSHLQEGEKFACELTTSGSYEYSGKDFTVVYNETDEELQGCSTTLKVENGSRITMTRTGKYNTEMILEKERRHTCCYSTPYGELMMGVYTRKLAADMNENGGTLNFAYTIDFNNDLASENELTVKVKTVESQEDK